MFWQKKLMNEIYILKLINKLFPKKNSPVTVLLCKAFELEFLFLFGNEKREIETVNPFSGFLSCKIENIDFAIRDV